MRGPAVALLLLAAALPARAASLSVEVEGVEVAAGRVFVALCSGGLSPAECRQGQSAPAAPGTMSFRFERVPEGTYALAAFQDLDGNGELDRTPLGLPLEPYALSGGAGRAARPSFRDAAFALREPGAAVRLRLLRPAARRGGSP